MEYKLLTIEDIVSILEFAPKDYNNEVLEAYRRLLQGDSEYYKEYHLKQANEAVACIRRKAGLE